MEAVNFIIELSSWLKITSKSLYVAVLNDINLIIMIFDYQLVGKKLKD